MLCLQLIVHRLVQVSLHAAGAGDGGLGVAALQVQSAVFKTCPGGQIGVWVEAAEIRVFRMRAQVKLKSWRNPRGGASRGFFVVSWFYYNSKINCEHYWIYSCSSAMMVDMTETKTAIKPRKKVTPTIIKKTAMVLPRVVTGAISP